MTNIGIYVTVTAGLYRGRRGFITAEGPFPHAESTVVCQNADGEATRISCRTSWLEAVSTTDPVPGVIHEDKAEAMTGLPIANLLPALYDEAKRILADPEASSQAKRVAQQFMERWEGRHG